MRVELGRLRWLDCKVVDRVSEMMTDERIVRMKINSVDIVKVSMICTTDTLETHVHCCI